MIQIDLHTIKMNTGVPDANGALWYVDGLDGWDSPALRQSFGQPTSRHGEVMLESMLGARSVVLRGLCKAQGVEGYWTAYNDLLALCGNLVTDRDLIVHEHVPKRLGVIRTGTPRIVMGTGSSFAFEVSLYARDPLKYRLSSQSYAIPAASTLVINSTGTFESYPVVDALGRFALRRMESNQSISTGDVFLDGPTVFDMRRRTAYRGTVNEYGKISPDSVWWALQPGANTIRNDGTTGITLTHTDAFI